MIQTIIIDHVDGEDPGVAGDDVVEQEQELELEEIAPPGTHAHNGLAESSIKKVSNLVTAMINRAPYFPPQHWKHAWAFAELLIHLRRSHIPGSLVTKWEEFTHQKPDVNDIVILPFGQLIEFYIPIEQRNTKFAKHSKAAFYCGPDLRTHKGIKYHTLFQPISNNRFIPATARPPTEDILMSVMTAAITGTAVSIPVATDPSPNTAIVIEKPPSDVNFPARRQPMRRPNLSELPVVVSPHSEGEASHSEGVHSSASEGGILSTNDQNITIDVANTPSNTATNRPRRSTGNYKDGPAKLRAVKHRDHDNPTWSQAIKRNDRDKWLAAAKEEMKQIAEDEHVITYLQKNEKLPHDANLIGTMFTCLVKRNKTTGDIDKYNVSLVALGNQQKESSYDKISSGTVRSSSVKLLLAIKAKTNAKSMILDIKGACLKSHIKESKK
eukprot:gene34431-44481_t